ncbi:MAG: hypothetical protein HC873_14565 [Leptolyngbyaceae cyanobacterium SL_1_1]|nr:hypothetical protein [Leptolyngbyaceae cyanobacterium RM2_2_21]NJN04494.1 hypothetical protein [Leptolyngbyaceae cyanobacterium RM1_1_2]NJO10665.1 hypothetical protein [Leptolyngbyaceae cyanobacterium SL_1_1]
MNESLVSDRAKKLGPYSLSGGQSLELSPKYANSQLQEQTITLKTDLDE